MRRLSLFLTLTLSALPSYYGQTAESKLDNEIAFQKSLLLSDLQSLEAKSAKIDQPLALALAKAEIANAAWKLDEVWAKKLLREAYELTLPKEEEQAKLRDQPAGSAPTPPTAIDNARNNIRNRVLSIANHDKGFADQLVQLGAQKLGKLEEHFRYAGLAARSIEANDTEAASKYLLQSLGADPTQITAGFVILDLAARDRAAADRLILQYIERLRTFPLSIANQSALRTYFILGNAIFTNQTFNPKYRQVPPASPTVIKAFLSFVIESLSRMEQSEPGSLKGARGILLSAWLPLHQHAPELASQFFELEKLSRRPGEITSLPVENTNEVRQSNYEKRVRDALNNRQPDEVIIYSVISKGDFDKARQLIEKLADGPQKTQFAETVNMQEAISLATEGDTLGAERLAVKLNKAASILQVYPIIINKCVTKKDQTCATTLVYQAMKQLKRAETTPPALPAGIPASAMFSSREFDPVSLSLSKLAMLVAPINDTLALEVLDEAILVINRSNVDTGQGRTGLDVDVFRKLAPANELRVRQAATNLKDSLQQIVALAGIYRWKAEELSKEVKAKQ